MSISMYRKRRRKLIKTFGENNSRKDTKNAKYAKSDAKPAAYLSSFILKKNFRRIMINYFPKLLFSVPPCLRERFWFKISSVRGSFTI